MTEPTAPSAPPAAEKAGMLEDYIDIFIAPAKVCARRIDANAFIPFLIVTVLLIGLFYASRNVMEPIFDQEISRQLAKMAKDNAALAKPDAMESARKMMNISFQWGAVIGMPILLLGLGIIVDCGQAVWRHSHVWHGHDDHLLCVGPARAVVCADDGAAAAARPQQD